MFNKVYLSRSQSRSALIEHPQGDPFGGAPYGEYNDPGTIATAVGAQIVGQIVGGAMGATGAGQAAGQQQQGYTNAANAVNLNYGAAQNLLSNQYGIAQPAITQNYGNAIAGFAPYRQAGSDAANALDQLITSGYATHQFNLQDLYNGLSPNYNFMLGQGQQSANAAANAAGGMIGGNAQQGLQQFTQNYASNAYQNAFNNYQTQRTQMFGNLQPVANMGLAATQSVGNLYAGQGNALAGLATGYGQTGANLYANQGNTLASAAVGSANAGAAGTLGQYDAYGNAISGAGNSIGNYALLSSLANKGGSTAITPEQVMNSTGFSGSGNFTVTPPA